MHKRSLSLAFVASLLMIAGPAAAQYVEPVEPAPVEPAPVVPVEPAPAYAPVTPVATVPVRVSKNRPHGYFGVQGLGFHVADQSTSFQTGYLGAGGGAGLFIGGRINPVISLEGQWDTTFHGENLAGPGGDTVLDRLYLMSFAGSLRLNIPTAGYFEPYFRLGGGYSLIGATWKPGYDFGDVFSHGPNFHVGVGAEIYAGPYFSLGGQVNYRGFYFGEPDLDERFNDRGDNYVSVIGFSLSATFHM